MTTQELKGSDRHYRDAVPVFAHSAMSRSANTGARVDVQAKQERGNGVEEEEVARIGQTSATLPHTFKTHTTTANTHKPPATGPATRASLCNQELDASTVKPVDKARMPDVHVPLPLRTLHRDPLRPPTTSPPRPRPQAPTVHA
eukprot:CAMPEP_0179438678 /NCGR_PEP_ID=MMETSP0799-20121207/22377_1 /TAXON_ID=46947 /ORGANISM="Geminigera cryophila, Strain CCMP2564" /LENGTH=143 /DNA_ID=CAMNT_0021220467 /DNA_START=66 /DNA_END=493 /DNA_ORIENTATION=-